MNRKLRLLGGIAAVGASLWLSGEAGAASSCATPDNNSTITTCFFDLTGSPSSTQTPSSAVLNDGIFRVPGANGDLGHGTIVGTGVFQPFVRIQETANGNSNGIEKGFNTDGSQGATILDNHDKGGNNWNHSIKLSDISKVTVCDGGGTTGTNCQQYYEFLLDTNEQGNSTNSGISLDEFKVFTATTGDITAYTGAAGTAGFSDFALTGATERYNMDTSPGGDASILTDYQNFSGSGNGVDLQALVPVANFAGVATDSFVYLYSKFGWASSQCLNPNASSDSPCTTPDGTTGAGTSVSPAGAKTPAGSLNFAADAGFEEWSFRKATGVPLPTTALLLGIGLAGFGFIRKFARA